MVEVNFASNEDVQVYWAVGEDMASLLSQAAITAAALRPLHVDVTTSYDKTEDQYTLTLYVY